MAKFGQGDERWLVQDLGQVGRNVNNWHWVESDALPWARIRLSELLQGLCLGAQGSELRVAEVKTVEGDAVVNNRKGKAIVAYELSVTAAWEAAADGPRGEIRMPYVSEENHDEDPEVLVTTAVEDAAGRACREEILEHGKARVHEQMRVFVKELLAGGPMQKTEGGAEEGAKAIAPSPCASSSGTSPAPFASEAPAPPSSSAKTAGRSIELEESFFAGAQELYDCFTDPRRVQAFTQSKVEMDPVPGGAFAWFGGSVSGRFASLEAPNRLVMEWRFSNWEDGVVSRVELDIEERERGNTRLRMKQTGIPEVDRHGGHDVVGLTRSGWKEQILNRIRRVFGYGA